MTEQFFYCDLSKSRRLQIGAFPESGRVHFNLSHDGASVGFCLTEADLRAMLHTLQGGLQTLQNGETKAA